MADLPIDVRAPPVGIPANRQSRAAFGGIEIDVPLVVRLDGNNVEEGRRILAEANHPLVVQAETMDAGADKAAELANK